MAMTVAELRVALEGIPGDRLVVLEKDAEGNGYSPLSDLGERLYVAANTWSGEVYPTREQVAEWVASGAWTQADADEQYFPGEDEGQLAVILGPVN